MGQFLITSWKMASAARRLIQFIDQSPSPFHVTQTASRLLEANGFKKIRETDSWQLAEGGKYYLTRNQSCLFAFVFPNGYNAVNGFNIIGTHTDSPCLRLRPTTKISSNGWQQVGVQTYGGGLWHTWFDRDLGIAGRVIVKNSNGELSHQLVNVNKPVVRVPTLCIHLSDDRENFKFNKETNMVPVISTTKKGDELPGEHPNHHQALMKVLSEELQCDPSFIQDFELCLFDTQPSTVGGALDEFVFAPRLDNLCSSFGALEALIGQADNCEGESRIRMATLFDHEEIGSTSVTGADSNMIVQVLNRICRCFPPQQGQPIEDYVEMAYRNSFLISADMAHAVHPNYASKHQSQHAPALHAGPVIKTNANQRYATSAVTGFLIRELATRNSIPIQDFVVRNDSPCGSTIGPLVSSMGFRVMDIGVPQLSMHSIREMCGTEDVEHFINLAKAFYSPDFSKLDKSLQVD